MGVKILRKQVDYKVYIPPWEFQERQPIMT